MTRIGGDASGWEVLELEEGLEKAEGICRGKRTAPGWPETSFFFFLIQPEMMSTPCLPVLHTNTPRRM